MILINNLTVIKTVSTYIRDPSKLIPSFLAVFFDVNILRLNRSSTSTSSKNTYAWCIMYDMPQLNDGKNPISI